MTNLPQAEKRFIQVFKDVRTYILNSNLQPGDLLPSEAALCQMLSVSRNVLREAIKSMEVMGMVKACPGRGTEVCAFNLDFVFHNVMFSTVGEDRRAISEMLDIRKRIELGYMRQAYQALTDTDVARIRQILEGIKAKWEDQVFFHADDRAFHMALFSHLDNKTLTSLLDAIWAVDEHFCVEEKLKHLDDTIIKHENIVRALEAHNQEAFEAAMLSHFSSGKYSRSAETFAEF